MYIKYGKRLFDIIFSITTIFVLFPIFLIIAILIKLFDNGPVIFTQARVGRYGREFIFFKFRSMPVNTPNLPSSQLKNVSISLIGKLIRRTNLDELPQLFNIFFGDMSFVGPRPSLISQDDLIELRKLSGALDCRPGLTGLAQINSYDTMNVNVKASFDALYSRDITFFGDCKIIARTFVYLIKPPPIY